MKLFKLPLLAIIFVLVACSTPIVQIQTICLPLVEYSGETQGKFVSELSSLQNSPTIEKFLGDYKALRDADRVCQHG